tara:strand:+ start:104 stop:961 length:858 start_codon:yes stop_codon:yes gene_type:complete
MNFLFKFFYLLLKFLNYFSKLFLSKDLLIHLKSEIENNSYQKKSINNKNTVFFIPNRIIQWRVNTIFDKEPETLEWIKSFKKKKKKIFWDVGANIGLYSIYAARIFKSIEIVSFEPSTSNLRVLSRNISLNNLENKVKIIPFALNKNKNIFNKIIESEFIEGGALNIFGEKFDYNGKKISSFENKYTIYGTNINHLLQDKILSIPNYIKIDVDGIEHLILQGGNNFFKNRNIYSVLIEINENFKEQFKSINKFMNKNNFKLLKKARNEEFYGLNHSRSFNYIFYR